ncbi:hypothetical protein PIB30_088967 [Stylosanthes scabra]|uniref:Uncharacterized protein n=1 Tax=Stylosanthes scabra TaxID=79078 RepID=A0ABU6ZSH2_9FABA|nr:hypothetical protein [Stylosanthes scabra]
MFEAHVATKPIIPEIRFHLAREKYLEIRAQIDLRGWEELCRPPTEVKCLLVREFYANAYPRPKERRNQCPYISYVRGVKVDYREDVRAKKYIAQIMSEIAENLPHEKPNLAFPVLSIDSAKL